MVRNLDLSMISSFRPIRGNKKYDAENQFNGTFDEGGKIIRKLKIKKVLNKAVGSKSSMELSRQRGKTIQNLFTHYV